MKKKIVIVLSVILICLIGVIVWYNTPLGLTDLAPDEVMEIVVFNGNSGETTHISDEQQIQHIIQNLNDVEVKRSKPSVGYMGYSFKMTIYLSDGNEADGWNNFIINSENTIRKDPFFYSVVSGEIDYDYIESIVKQSTCPLRKAKPFSQRAFSVFTGCTIKRKFSHGSDAICAESAILHTQREQNYGKLMVTKQW